MDKTKAEADKICMNAANIIRAIDAADEVRRQLDIKLMQHVKEYSTVARVWGWSRDHMRQACKARGFLL